MESANLKILLILICSLVLVEASIIAQTPDTDRTQGIGTLLESQNAACTASCRASGRTGEA